MDLYQKLSSFHQSLKDYRNLLGQLSFHQPLPDNYQHKREGLLLDSSRLIRKIKELTGRDESLEIYVSGKPHSINMWEMGLRNEYDYRTVEAIDACIDNTIKAIGKLEAEGESWGAEKVRTAKARKEPPKVFIAHEGMTRALDKVKSFLDALGIKYLIAEIEPSDGRVVEEQVEWAKEQADFAIVLATKGKVVDKETGKSYMGMNVADELGRAREVFKNRIILLLQKGVEPHTNISGIVYEPFTTQYMENVFKKIVKEIRNWGLI